MIAIAVASFLYEKKMGMEIEFAILVKDLKVQQINTQTSIVQLVNQNKIKLSEGLGVSPQMTEGVIQARFS